MTVMSDGHMMNALGRQERRAKDWRNRKIKKLETKSRLAKTDIERDELRSEIKRLHGLTVIEVSGEAWPIYKTLRKVAVERGLFHPDEEAEKARLRLQREEKRNAKK